MRLGEWKRAVCGGLPWFVLVLWVGSVEAQFREVNPEGESEPAVEIRLTPTKEAFVAPRHAGEPTIAVPTDTSVIEPVPQGVPTPVEPVEVGDPTPAEPTSALVEPASEPTTTVPETSPAEPKATPQLQQGDVFAVFRQSSTDKPTTGAPTPTTTPHAVTFNEVTPGETTLVQVKTLWGEPAKSIDDESGKIMIYRAPGFQQVDLLAERGGDVVSTIVVHLTDIVELNQIEKYLQLEDLRPVDVVDQAGVVLGRGYAERGVLLSCEGSEGCQKISHVALEPIKAELFRLRAERDQNERYTQSLADLEQATRLDQEDAKAYWLQSEVLAVAGRLQDAWDAVTVASRIEPENPLYQLTRARLAAGNGDLTEATLFTKNVAQDKSAPSLVRARAEYQWGNLLAMGTKPDMQEAINHHLKAVDLAAKYVRDKNIDVRRMAKDVLVDAHLAVAQDIALGNFQRQRDVVPKWLTRATELAEEFIASDAGDPTMRMEIFRTTLAVYSVLEGNFDASIATEEAIKEGQRLVAQSQDRLYQFRVERELSETLYHAAKVEFRCGRLPSALRYANNAVVLLEGDKAGQQPSLFDRVMGGQLYFLTGSIYAMLDADHVEAAKWFDKAIPEFDDERLVNLVDTSAFGDVFVSMGVSYWESGDRDKAIQLTQAGAELIQDGVQSGVMEMNALAVPYGNLAAMHQHLGNGDQAEHFATMLAKVESDDTDTIRR